MLKKIDGLIYKDLIESGIKNLDKHRNIVNDLNVFPVPDGDTGTNMVMTLKYGFEAIKNKVSSLEDMSQSFSTSAVFGARGNSGVIISQFFKGVTEILKCEAEADANILIKALESGYHYAYDSVATPVEGTMLTVFKESIEKVKENDYQTIDEVINSYIEEANKSLEHTPELLPILKKAGVVDSGGAGIVYFFEGIKKFLNGEEIETNNDETKTTYIDLSKFNKDTNFEYGYCIEGLIQLKMDVSEFDEKAFNEGLFKLGESIVTTLENDKVKLHIHSKVLSGIMEYCQRYGEFLTIKIENMTVQNMELDGSDEEVKFLYSEDAPLASFAIVAVATNKVTQQKLHEMGADVVILSKIAPSSQDFMEAYAHAKSNKILVFPNSSNSVLAAEKAGTLFEDAEVTVLNTHSLPECYSALSIIDFDEDIERAIASSKETIENAYHVGVFHAVLERQFGSKHIQKDEFFSLSKNHIISVAKTLELVTIETVKKVCSKNDYYVVTIFYGKGIDEEYIEYLTNELLNLGLDIEIANVSTFETMYSLILTFE